MVQVQEANLSQAMNYVYDTFIKPLDTKGILAYRPITQGKSQPDKQWLYDNPTTGVLYLKKHPNAKVAWVLVKFEHKTFKEYGMSSRAQNKIKITNLQEFKDFFGVSPGPDFKFTDDMAVYVRWDREQTRNTNPKRNFDETTPNFYMYTNHLKINLDKVIQRLYRINDIINKEPNAVIGNQFNIPYSATNI